jgi:protein phosphatase
MAWADITQARVASGIAVAMLTTEMKQALDGHAPHELDSSGETLATKFMRETSAKANAAIYHTAKSQPQYAGMGTTLAVALFHNNQVTVGHIGDSRLYRLRGIRLSRSPAIILCCRSK